jgi:hypothetical protein
MQPINECFSHFVNYFANHSLSKFEIVYALGGSRRESFEVDGWDELRLVSVILENRHIAEFAFGASGDLHPLRPDCDCTVDDVIATVAVFHPMGDRNWRLWHLIYSENSELKLTPVTCREIIEELEGDFRDTGIPGRIVPSDHAGLPGTR